MKYSLMTLDQYTDCGSMKLVYLLEEQQVGIIPRYLVFRYWP